MLHSAFPTFILVQSIDIHSNNYEMGPLIHACSSSKTKEVLCWDGNIESILALVNLSEVRITFDTRSNSYTSLSREIHLKT